MNRRKAILAGLLAPLAPLAPLAAVENLQAAENTDKKFLIVVKLFVSNLSPPRAEAFSKRILEKLSNKPDYMQFVIFPQRMSETSFDVYELQGDWFEYKDLPIGLDGDVHEYWLEECVKAGKLEYLNRAFEAIPLTDEEEVFEYCKTMLGMPFIKYAPVDYVKSMVNEAVKMAKKYKIAKVNEFALDYIEHKLLENEFALE